MDVDVDFNDLIVYDLTNYPNTLTKLDIDKIVPKELFSKVHSEQEESLIKVKFSSLDPQIYNIPDSNIASKVKVDIKNICIFYYK